MSFGTDGARSRDWTCQIAPHPGVSLAESKVLVSDLHLHPHDHYLVKHLYLSESPR